MAFVAHYKPGRPADGLGPETAEARESRSQSGWPGGDDKERCRTTHLTPPPWWARTACRAGTSPWTGLLLWASLRRATSLMPSCVQPRRRFLSKRSPASMSSPAVKCIAAGTTAIPRPTRCSIISGSRFLRFRAKRAPSPSRTTTPTSSIRRRFAEGRYRTISIWGSSTNSKPCRPLHANL